MIAFIRRYAVQIAMVGSIGLAIAAGVLVVLALQK